MFTFTNHITGGRQGRTPEYSEGPILTDISELDQENIKSEKVIRVIDSRVLYANYKLLQHDFPILSEAALTRQYPKLGDLKSNEKELYISNIIDNWLIRHFSFISKSQARQCEVNDSIKTGTETVTAHRPPGYGRALVYSLEEINRDLDFDDSENKYPNLLIDVKGTGVAPDKVPINKTHSDGLHWMGYALAELVVGSLLNTIFRHSGSHFETLPIYGIIDLGFNITTNHIPHGPAGLLLRRAHRRPKKSGGLFPYDSPGQKIQLAIEQLLRKYGITSVNGVTRIKIWKENNRLKIDYHEQNIDFYSEKQLKEIERVSHFKDKEDPILFDGINVQHTREISLNPLKACLVDFESYSSKALFENPLLSLVSDKLLRWGGTIWPHYDNYVQANTALKIPHHLFSATGTILDYNYGSKWAKVYSLCFGLACDYGKNLISRKQLLQTIENYFNAITGHLYKDASSSAL